MTGAGEAARRDRHGRGLRGPLLPPGLPGARSRAERFDDLVLESVARLTDRWGDALQAVEIVVEDVPPVADDAAEVALSRAEPATLDAPARIVVHRRPVEARASGGRAREELVHDVVVDAVADLLGLAPEVVDPGRDGDLPDDD